MCDVAEGAMDKGIAVQTYVEYLHPDEMSKLYLHILKHAYV